MDMESELDRISDTIRGVVEQQLQPARVTEVVLHGEFDHDGDPILRIQIVLEMPEGGLDPSKVRGLIRHLREPLNDFSEVGFPVLSITTPAELPPEAA